MLAVELFNNCKKYIRRSGHKAVMDEMEASLGAAGAIYKLNGRISANEDIRKTCVN
jgi:hypothetical protein